ncbi:MAG: bifunctional methylenetetrahydrofolate dehydrogenase/methenyltetrahydrofolate cyclohydrolase FolD [Clostridia bacterium]|nr:bifunctional methylenetetrahydrofolate dehydrogenase/methenyltetrahydrofolate cyclohydrolase FolD [Clostridia bacterium]
MSAEILDGKELSKKIKENLKNEVDKLKEQGINPKLAVIMVGDNSASAVYVKNKSNACKKVGIDFEEFLLPEETTEDELIELIEKLNVDNTVDGILLQSPVPNHININRAFETISPKKDVDGFNAVNVGNLTIGRDCFVSCTPYGVMRMLEEYNIDVAGKTAVVIGRSNIVGKPMLQCLLSKDATVTICHSKTKNLEEVVSKADIVIAAIGKPNFVTGNMIKDGAVVIDVGINRLEDGKLCGDVNFEEASQKASYITPVPGGVGPMTVAMLVENVVKAAKQK